MISKPLDHPLPKLWDDFALRPYLGEIRRRHGIVETLALPSMRDLPPLRIETTFVSPLLSEKIVNPYTDKWPEGKNLLNALEAFQRLVVLGDPGGGKTTLSNWLAWRLSSGLTSPLPSVLEDRVPLPCILREMPPKAFAPDLALPDLAVLMADTLLGENADENLKDSLCARVRSGHYVLILDGVDEIPDASRKIVAGWIKQAKFQNACVLATSRIVGYDDYPVHCSILEPGDIQKLQKDPRSPEELSACPVEKTDIPGFEEWAKVLYLMPFDQHRINIFAENWYRQRCGTEQEAKQKTEDLLASLTKSEVTRQLARTPNLLSLMVIVHRERAHLPDGRALLYDEIANAYINTIDQQRKILPGDALAPYGWKERKTWLASIGFQMQLLRKHPGKKKFPASEISDDGLLAQRKDVMKWLVKAMKDSGVKDPFSAAKEFLEWVARRSGLLLPRGKDRYAFVHLSFQEYFCACYLDTCIVRPNFFSVNPTNLDPVSTDKDNSNEVNTKNLRIWCGLSIWRETFVYLFELFSAEHGSDWVDALANILFIQNSDEGQNFDEKVGMLAGRILINQHIHNYGPWKAQLKYVDFHDTSVTDLTPLAGLKNLLFLYLGKTSITDLTPLAGLKNLQYLNFRHTDVSDLTPLKKLKNLQYLGFRHTKVTDLAPLAGLKNLQYLNFRHTDVSDLTPLKKLKNLQNLNLRYTKVTDLTPLAGLNKLRSLDLEGISVSDLKPLKGLKNLQDLDLSHTKVSDLTHLAGLKNLLQLELEDTDVTDLKPLKGLKNLQYLDLIKIPVTDLKPLAGLKNLQSLYLVNTRVTDLTPLAGLKELRWLHLGNTFVTDLTPLAGLENLSIQH